MTDDGHIDKNRLREVAERDLIFTEQEFSHVKHCTDCFTAWAAKLAVSMIKSTWRCGCGTNVKVIAESDRLQAGFTFDVACPNCGMTQSVYGQTLIVVTGEPDGRDYSN